MCWNLYGIIFVLIAAWVEGQESIPPDLLRQIKMAQSMNELSNVATILKPSASYGRSASRYRSGSMPQIKINGASLIAFPSNGRRGSSTSRQTDEDMEEDLNILSLIRQGNDTCTLQSICVPVPVDNPDPGMLVFPRCYQINQCVGGCCDSIENCHPTAIEYLHKPIVEMVYVGHHRFVINQTRNITMEQHIACSCKDCSLEGPPPECIPGYVIGATCQCECGNQLDKYNCKGGRKRWNEATCSCECPVRYCRGGGVLNEELCLCEESSYIHLKEPGDGGSYRSDVSHRHRFRSHIRHFP